MRVRVSKAVRKAFALLLRTQVFVDLWDAMLWFALVLSNFAAIILAIIGSLAIWQIFLLCLVVSATVSFIVLVVRVYRDEFGSELIAFDRAVRVAYTHLLESGAGAKLLRSLENHDMHLDSIASIMLNKEIGHIRGKYREALRLLPVSIDGHESISFGDDLSTLVSLDTMANETILYSELHIEGTALDRVLKFLEEDSMVPKMLDDAATAAG